MSRLLRAGSLAAIAAVALLLAVAGCSKQPRLTQPDPLAESAGANALLEPADPLAAPDLDAARGFFPLALGNRWAYRGRTVSMSVFNDGPAYRDERRYRQHDALICAETIGDRSYLVARQRQIFVGGIEYDQWIRYRQDRDGLFEADVSTGEPPACDPTAVARAGRADRGIALESLQREIEDPELQAAVARARAEAMARLELARRAIGLGGVDGAPWDGRTTPEGPGSGELTRLAYPLHVGARWVIRHDPRFVSAVVAHESLELPVGRRAGFKVRIDSELFGPDDRVHFWVSRIGFLQHDIRVFAPITDAGGVVIGQFTARDHRELVNYALRRPGRSGEPHAAPEVAAAE